MRIILNTIILLGIVSSSCKTGENNRSIEWVFAEGGSFKQGKHP